MHRRSMLNTAATVGIAGLLAGAGCLNRDSPTEPASKQDDSDTTTLTNDGVTATFSVGGGQSPTDDTASARRDDGVVVTGTMDPTGCNRPTLERVDYGAVDGVLHLKLGVADRYPDREVACDNASFGYTCRCVVDEGTPETVELRYAYAGREPAEFTLDLG